jgi:hypothetical protein
MPSSDKLTGELNDNKSVRAESAEESLTKDSEVLLVEGEDYYLENGLYVFTSSFLLRRGYCCDSGCRNCPYPKESNE